MPIIRCCVDKYKVTEFEARMPDDDETFPYPNHHGEAVTVQDCWRSKENAAEQEAVRKLLRRMNFEVVELEENRERTKFAATHCISLSRRATPRLPRKDFFTARKVFFNRTPTSKSENSCTTTARKSKRKKLQRIAITACAV